MKKIVISLLFISSNLCSFNFDGPLYPYLFLSEYEALQEKLLIDDESCLYCWKKLLPIWNWHKTFFLSLYENQQVCNFKDMTIVILDTDIFNEYKRCACGEAYSHRVRFFFKTQENLAAVEKCRALDHRVVGKRCRFNKMMKKKQYVQNLIQKNHSYITVQIIESIAPNVTIIILPILNEYGTCLKKELLVGLQLAQKYNPTILHLGLQIQNFDKQDHCDQEIEKILSKFPYVVAAAGNNGIATVGYPANMKNVISVGSFVQNNDKYFLSGFSQGSKNSKVDFLCPGENIIAKVWVEDIEEYIYLPVSGTSIAAACMSGVLSLILHQNQGQLRKKKIMNLLYHYSKQMDQSWNDVALYGMPQVSSLQQELYKKIKFYKK